MIIAFIGEYKSGKDHMCEHLVRNYNATRLSFSDEVRRLTVQIFPWMPMDFDPSVKDLPFINESNPKGLSPRDIWLTVGKVRDVDPKYFVKAFIHHNFDVILNADKEKLYIITDFRTADEWDLLSSMNVPVIKIQREDRAGIPPNAFEDFVRNFTSYNALFTNRMNGTDEFDAFFKGFKDVY